MRRVVRWVVVAVVAIHGTIHLMGVVEGFGWADVSELKQPISTATGFAWLAAALLVVAAAVLLAARPRWWWSLGVLAAIASQAVIVTSWTDARAGTIGNVILLIAAGHGFLAEGPRSLRARFRRLAAATSARSAGPPAAVVTETDLARLPATVAAYVAASGAIGRPHVRGMRTRIHGRIRSGAGSLWMPFTGEQVNTFGPSPTRIFSMDATMSGLPVDVLHEYVGATATMTAKAMSAVTVMHAEGTVMDRSETVTLLNDLCVMCPAALVDAPITWMELDDRHARATYTNGLHAVSAVLVFDDDHRLVDFVSDDRSRASAGGRSFTPIRWSTPIGDYRMFAGRSIASHGTARWCPGNDEDDVEYLDIHVDDIVYDESVHAPEVRPTALTASQV